MRALVLSAVLVSSPALAHDFWIEPSAFTPEAGKLVTLKLKVGERLGGETLPRDESRIEWFAAVDGRAASPVLGIDGSDPAGVFRPTAPGGVVVAYRGLRTALELPHDKFRAYLALEGLKAVAPGREVFSRCAKSLVAVDGRGGPALTHPVGLTLELTPEADPYTLAPGDGLTVRLLYEGAPLAGALVMALDAVDADTPQQVRSDALGRATFRLPRSGSWLVKAVHMIRAPRDAGAEWESFWASLTFSIRAREPGVLSGYFAGRDHPSGSGAP